MAEYKVIRNMPYFGEQETSMKDIISFTAGEKGIDTYFGLYDFESNDYLVFGPFDTEIHTMRVETDGDESIADFENKLATIAYEMYVEHIQINKVATDYSLMRKMEW